MGEKMKNKIAVVGAGTMGAGIAQVALEAGYKAHIVDIEERFVKQASENIKKFIGKKVTKGTISQQQYDEMLSRLAITTDVQEAVEGATMVVEAVFEKLDIKKDIFQKLDSLCPEDVILATNTSTLSISEIATATKKPGRVIGTHYFSPVPVMNLVEVVKGKETSEETIQKTIEFCKALGKSPIVVKDIPGFIVNRFFCILYNEAANMVYKEMAEAKDIDAALKLGLNWPMGPLEAIDLAGIDIAYAALQAMYQMTHEERYNPSPLFEKYMAQNRKGRKTKWGFYDY
jgi:3-hydroxybutyryl-CoA dehydrogenase